MEFEDIAVGMIEPIGSFIFTAEAIKAFAVRYDPQPFHVDEEAAARSHFGGLVASGWHVAAVWMKLMVAHRDGQARLARVAGRPAARLGPSPGFRDMVWAKPVMAGDALAYRVEITGKKERPARPEWGLVLMRSFAANQRGEDVFRFDGAVFWGRRG